MRLLFPEIPLPRAYLGSLEKLLSWGESSAAGQQYGIG